ncbi:hypothetical protein Zmor_007373 [Zophobas morio]|uniref:Uncharacterized protein n=1 Tax=Zophobas morio TaxID=2755281 RepID=A0AA38IY03_9CUCU|nr:hypothetical protein Zmor_025274 [Zophobas morio]KAJ3663064.1 hypothetical protein Zmor_007373 [Zophobas morio]
MSFKITKKIKKFLPRVIHPKAVKQDAQFISIIGTCAIVCLLVLPFFLKSHTTVLAKTHYKQITIAACTT